MNSKRARGQADGSVAAVKLQRPSPAEMESPRVAEAADLEVEFCSADVLDALALRADSTTLKALRVDLRTLKRLAPTARERNSNPPAFRAPDWSIRDCGGALGSILRSYRGLSRVWVGGARIERWSDALPALDGLRTLSLVGCFTAAIVPPPSTVPGVQVDLAGLAQAPGAAGIEELEVSDGRFHRMRSEVGIAGGGAGLASLAALPRLRSLTFGPIGGFEKSADWEHVPVCPSSFPALETLRLRGLGKASDFWASAAPAVAYRLTELEICDLPDLEQAANLLSALAKAGLPRLLSLRLRNLGRYIGPDEYDIHYMPWPESLARPLELLIAACAPTLQTLVVDCVDQTSACVVAAERAPNLRSLMLRLHKADPIDAREAMAFALADAMFPEARPPTASADAAAVGRMRSRGVAIDVPPELARRAGRSAAAPPPSGPLRLPRPWRTRPCSSSWARAALPSPCARLRSVGAWSACGGGGGREAAAANAKLRELEVDGLRVACWRRLMAATSAPLFPRSPSLAELTVEAPTLVQGDSDGSGASAGGGVGPGDLPQLVLLKLLSLGSSPAATTWAAALLESCLAHCPKLLALELQLAAGAGTRTGLVTPAVAAALAASRLQILEIDGAAEADAAALAAALPRSLKALTLRNLPWAIAAAAAARPLPALEVFRCLRPSDAWNKGQIVKMYDLRDRGVLLGLEVKSGSRWQKVEFAPQDAEEDDDAEGDEWE
eukprot:tig00020904_g15254.t1